MNINTDNHHLYVLIKYGPYSKIKNVELVRNNTKIKPDPNVIRDVLNIGCAQRKKNADINAETANTIKVLIKNNHQEAPICHSIVL